MNRTMNRKRAVLLLVATSILWSFSGICIKVMSWNGFAIAGLRSVLAAVVMLFYGEKPSVLTVIGGTIVLAAICGKELIQPTLK